MNAASGIRQGTALTRKQWNLENILPHVATHLPLAALFGMEIVAAEPGHRRVRLVGNEHIRRPGGSIAGPVLFAMADVATYALTLALRHEETAVTSSLLMNFLRPAADRRGRAAACRKEPAHLRHPHLVRNRGTRPADRAGDRDLGCGTRSGAILNSPSNEAAKGVSIV
jgi:uncharacterized protein (TIGR00369 family)